MLCSLLLALTAAASPAQTIGTAWTEPAGSARLDVGIGGSSTYELGALVGLQTGVTERLQLGTNIAHNLLGLANLHARTTLLRRGSTGLALSLGAAWLDLARADYIPDIDPDIDSALEGIDIFLLPISVVWSQERERLGLDLAAGWDLAWVAGSPSSEVLLLDGAVGARRAWVAPSARVMLTDRLALRGRVVVPLYAAGRTVAVAEYVAEEGIVVGVRSSDWFPLPAQQTASARLYAELSRPSTCLRVGVTTSALVRAVGVPVIPYVQWSRRVGLW